MKWIIGVIVSLVTLNFFLKRYSRKMNPMNTLSYDGILGIKIGDSRDFALSRIKHLKLLNDADVLEQPLIFKYGFDTEYITAARGMFNNIEKVGINFDKSGTVNGFSINFENYFGNLRETFRSVNSKIDSKIGKPVYTDNNAILWRNGDNCIHVLLEEDGVTVVINRS